MKYSNLFGKTQKTTPKDEISLNAKLLIKAGFIQKEMSGVYAFLPLGLKTIQKTTEIIRTEMNKLGGQEILLGSLQNPEVWKTTNRWDDKVLDVWFKTKLKNGKEVGLATTHEEPLTKIMLSYIHSYKDLPLYLYQIQNKFRNELRSRSGLLRTREFIMKDLYSFNENKEDLDKFYDKAIDAYTNIFKESGIGSQTYLTFASGGSFSKFSHEFQTVCENGEDTIYIDQDKRIGINKEVYSDKVIKELKLNKANIKQVKATEVGNIFKLGTKYSKVLNLIYKNEKGKDEYVVMGCYGIGPGRLIATIVETHNDENGIIWPISVAPFQIHLISLEDDKNIYDKSEEIYKLLTDNGTEVLWDERKESSAGVKFHDADLIGIPIRLVISKKSLSQNGIEIKLRNEQKIDIIKFEDLVNTIKVKITDLRNQLKV